MEKFEPNEDSEPVKPMSDQELIVAYEEALDEFNETGTQEAKDRLNKLEGRVAEEKEFYMTNRLNGEKEISRDFRQSREARSLSDEELDSWINQAEYQVEVLSDPAENDEDEVKREQEAYRKYLMEPGGTEDGNKRYVGWLLDERDRLMQHGLTVDSNKRYLERLLAEKARRNQIEDIKRELDSQ